MLTNNERSSAFTPTVGRQQCKLSVSIPAVVTGYHENTPLQRIYIYTSNSLVWCRDLDVNQNIECKIDSFDQRCQRRILRIHYSQHVSNHEVRRLTDCIPASEIIQSRRLKLFRYTARADVEELAGPS